MGIKSFHSEESRKRSDIRSLQQKQFDMTYRRMEQFIAIRIHSRIFKLQNGTRMHVRFNHRVEMF